MSQDADDNKTPGAGPSTFGPELALAGFLMVLAGFVITDSIRVGIGWADDGPKSGYFPFRIGLLLLGASGWVFLSTLLKRHEKHPLFAERSQLATVLAMLVPMVVYVGGIALLGLYVSSIVLIGYFMKRYGKFGWPLTAAVSVGVPLAFFLVFERWFLVPLPKGPIERLFGF